MARNEVPEGFEFRPFANGPERDVARALYELVEDLGWMKTGPEWDAFMEKLLEAREAGLAVAKTMLRS